MRRCLSCGSDFSPGNSHNPGKFCSRSCTRTGQPRKLPRVRFFEKIERKPNGCWEWLGARKPTGYGVFSRTDRSAVRAHRWAYEEFVGPIPAGMSVCHRCDNPPCVNPDHLWLGTQADNVHDMIKKGRGGWGV